jgi:hypothetical protein
LKFFSGRRDFISPYGKKLTDRSVFSDSPIFGELIKTLKVIAGNGSDTFYRGVVGQGSIL